MPSEYGAMFDMHNQEVEIGVGVRLSQHHTAVAGLMLLVLSMLWHHRQHNSLPRSGATTVCAHVFVHGRVVQGCHCHVFATTQWGWGGGDYHQCHGGRHWSSAERQPQHLGITIVSQRPAASTAWAHLQCVALLDLQIYQNYFISPWEVLHTWEPYQNVGDKLYIATSLWYADGIQAFISSHTDAQLQAAAGAMAQAVMVEAKLNVFSSSGTELTVPLGPVAAEFWVRKKEYDFYKCEPIVTVGPMMEATGLSGSAPTIKPKATEEPQWVFTEFDPSDPAIDDE
jgi:hypothetical protein